MKKVRTSIEYSHIYTNETFSHEHLTSVDKLKELLSDDVQGPISKIILIDNYNSTEDLLDIPDLLERLELCGAKPDFYAFESDMGKYQDEMLGLIGDSSIRRSYQRYIKDKNHLPCSFMTAIWYMIRLGEFPLKESGIIKSNGNREFLPADQLINILPERFKDVENKTQQLLQSAGIDVERLRQVYYDSVLAVEINDL